MPVRGPVGGCPSVTVYVLIFHFNIFHGRDVKIYGK